MRRTTICIAMLACLGTSAMAADLDAILDAKAETTITATKDDETRDISTCRDYFELTGKQGWQTAFEVDDGAPIMDFEVNCALNLFVAQLADGEAQDDGSFADISRFSSEFACLASGCDEAPQAMGESAQINANGFAVNGLTFELGPLHHGRFTGEDRPEAMVKLKWWQDGEAVQQSVLAVLFEENGIIRPLLVSTTNALQEKPDFENF